MISAAMLSSRPTCWNRTYSGTATAIGGRIRCEISQNAMSLLPKARVNRRPMVWARISEDAEAPRRPRSASGAPERDAIERERDRADEQADDPDPRAGR